LRLRRRIVSDNGKLDVIRFRRAGTGDVAIGPVAAIVRADFRNWVVSEVRAKGEPVKDDGAG
jgi:hypothetical protein